MPRWRRCSLISGRRWRPSMAHGRLNRCIVLSRWRHAKDLGSRDMYGFGVLKGLSVVFNHLFQKPITRQYPEEPATLSPRFRGYDFAWVEPRCTACATCAKACPHGCIDIVTHEQEDGRYGI